METTQATNQPEIIHVTAKDDEAITMESLCPRCMQNGETRMLLTEIPFFRSVIISSFSCEVCYLRNTEVQSSGSLCEFGTDIYLTVTSKEDLERDIVRGEWATTYIPELDLTIPCTRKGYMSTLEGFMTSFRDDLQLGQIERRRSNPEYADQIKDFIRKLNKYIVLEDDILPFTFRLCDPSGNSFIQNPKAPQADPNLRIDKFSRKAEHLEIMGYLAENAEQSTIADGETKKIDEETKKQFEALRKEHFGELPCTKIGLQAKYTKEDTDKMIQKMQETNQKISAHKMDFTQPFEDQKGAQEAMEFEVECNNCPNMGYCRMCTCAIPYFKEIIIMAFTCESCGLRSTDVKVGGGFPDQATKYEILVEKEEDLNRDVFKSETAEIQLPDIGCVVMSGSLGGVYSTVEGLLDKMLGTLRDDNPFVGDSAEVDQKSNFENFLVKLQEMKEGKHLPFKMVLDDPMSSCFIQNPYHPESDPLVTVTVYDRTFEQNEDLGINDMNV